MYKTSNCVAVMYSGLNNNVFPIFQLIACRQVNLLKHLFYGKVAVYYYTIIIGCAEYLHRMNYWYIVYTIVYI